MNRKVKWPMQLVSKQLNYNLYSNADRANQVRDLFDLETTEQYKSNYSSPTVQADLEKIANFILYGFHSCTSCCNFIYFII